MVFRPRAYQTRSFYRRCKKCPRWQDNSGCCLVIGFGGSQRKILQEPRRRTPKNPEKELLGDPEGDFLLSLIRSEIWKVQLKKLRSKYHISSSFELELPLEIDRVCNPPPSRLILYKEYFPTRLRLPLVPFFDIFFRTLGCLFIPSHRIRDGLSMVF